MILMSLSSTDNDGVGDNADSIPETNQRIRRLVIVQEQIDQLSLRPPIKILTALEAD